MLLEACLKRVETKIRFRRLMCHLEGKGLMPSEMFAYRKQLPGPLAGMTLRWLLAWWVGRGVTVRLLDWDESNADCNIPREDLPAALSELAPTLGRWATEFYRHFRVRGVTAWSFTSPYGMVHGSGQGDSGGVGVYTALGALRTLFHRGVLA